MRKINYDEFAKLANYKKPHRLMKLCCSFTIEECTYTDVIRARMKLFWFIILFIPACVFEFFGRIWTDIIMDFDFPSRWIANYRIDHKYNGN